jgi:hypothetical protein
MFMGCSVPGSVSPEFLEAVKPLALDLLQKKWRILGFRELMGLPTQEGPRTLSHYSWLTDDQEVIVRSLKGPLYAPY